MDHAASTSAGARADAPAVERRAVVAAEPSAATPAWHALPAAEVVRALGVDPERGLAGGAAAAAPAHDETTPSGRGTWTILIEQLTGGVILVLLAATAVMIVLGHYGDAAAIGAAVLFSIVFGFVTDVRAERALDALRQLTGRTARVVRGGLELEVAVGELRVGDLVVLSAGHIVAADGRIVAVRDLQLDESALTGESVPASKSVDPVAEAAALPDRTSMAYAGTTVVSGSGRMVVTAVRGGTELGRIGRLVAEQPREPTPLERQAEELGRRLALLAIGLSALVTVLGLLRGVPFWLMVETGVILAIAAIPEGLPAATTIALAAGVRRMARAQSLVRRLASVETLGSTTVICTDKTGTLTENVMRVTRVVLPHATLDVTGAGYDPSGSFVRDGRPVAVDEVPGLRQLLEVAAVCNDARLESHAGWHVHGSSTEGALLALAAKAGVGGRSFERVASIGFSSERKRMCVVARAADGTVWSFVKGSPEAVVPCATRILGPSGEEPLDAEGGARVLATAARVGAAGFRVLGLARRRLAAVPAMDAAEDELTWVGLVALIDPPRAGVREAIAELRDAGIRTVMVTGDQKGTAMAIARELRIAQSADLCLDSAEVAAYAAARRWDDLRSTAVFARVTPEDKLRIVRALRDAGEVVAMTGDGINDAPALRAADIGIAVGRGAADVAREASDLVVTSGDYATLPLAVAEGRHIYGNIRRAVHFLLLCSLATIAVMLVAAVTDLALPLSPLQLLWLNLVVHVFPAMALVVVPGEVDVMRRPPRNPGEPILPWSALGTVALRSALVAGVVLWSYAAKGRHGGEAHGQTLVMATLALVLLVQAFATLSPTAACWHMRRSLTPAFWAALAGGLALQAVALYWPPLADVLGTVPLRPVDLLAIGASAALALAVVEAGKVLAAGR
jgi:Ca2+-transporting ATPase